MALGIAMVTAAFSLTPTAKADLGHYASWSGILAPNQWSLYGARHTYSYLTVAFFAGRLPQCAKLIAPDSTPELTYARSCQNTNSFTINSGLGGRATFPNYTTLMYGLIANGNSGANHLIHGYLEY